MQKLLVVIGCCLYLSLVLFTYGHATVSQRAYYPSGDNRPEIAALLIAPFAPLYWSIKLNEALQEPTP